MAYQYDRKSRRYRDLSTGRWVSQSTLIELSENYIKQQQSFGQGLAARYAVGLISPDQFLSEMRSWIKTNYTVQFLIGRGGRNAVEFKEWDQLGKLVNAQYAYATKFAKELASGTISSERVADRVQMYADTSHEALWLGVSKSWDVDLPSYPADGSTSCGSRCRCTWTLKEVDKGAAVEARWELGAAANHCGDCNDRATMWSPLRIDRPV